MPVAQQAAVALLVELRQGAAGVGGDPVGRHAGHNLLPVDADGAQGVAGAEDGQLQRPRVAAGGVQRLRIEPPGHHSRRADADLAPVGHQQVAAVADDDAHPAAVAPLDAPPGRQMVGQLAAGHLEGDRAVGVRQPHLAVPRCRVGVEDLRLEAAYQAVVGETPDGGLVERTVETGQARQAAPHRRGAVRVEAIDHRAPVAVVARGAAGGVDAAEADDDRNPAHDLGLLGWDWDGLAPVGSARWR